MKGRETSYDEKRERSIIFSSSKQRESRSMPAGKKDTVRGEKKPYAAEKKSPSDYLRKNLPHPGRGKTQSRKKRCPLPHRRVKKVLQSIS